MPTFTLSAVPATRTDEGGYLSTEMRLSDTLGARAQVEARTIEDVAEAVLHFSRALQDTHPESSFVVFVAIAKGQRKPRGFDLAYKSKKLRNEAFLWTVLKTPVPHGDDAGVVMWGSRFTPFRLDGQPPILRDDAPDDFTPHADGHLGLYGWLRMVNAGVQRTSHGDATVFDLASGVTLREAYRARRHPFAVAEELLATANTAHAA